MSLPLIPPPVSVDPETARWFMELMVQVSASFSELETSVASLKKRVEALEKKVP